MKQTLAINVYMQHMQYTFLLLQHLYETFATSETSATIETYVYNIGGENEAG
jgi:hypothetical protein